MGWDAFAYYGNSMVSKMLETQHLNAGGSILLSPYSEVRKEFVKAAEIVEAHGSGVDSLLHEGILGCSACGRMLQMATNMDCWHPYLTEWDTKLVKKLHLNADWNFEPELSLAWAYWRSPPHAPGVKLQENGGRLVNF